MGALQDRMTEDLEVRGYAQNTIATYVRCVGRFAKHFELPPGRLGPENIRQYMLHLARDKKLSASSQNVYAGAIEFFYRTTLKRPDVVQGIARRDLPHQGWQHRHCLRRGVPASLRAARAAPRLRQDPALRTDGFQQRHNSARTGPHPARRKTPRACTCGHRLMGSRRVRRLDSAAAQAHRAGHAHLPDVPAAHHGPSPPATTMLAGTAAAGGCVIARHTSPPTHPHAASAAWSPTSRRRCRRTNGIATSQ